MPNFTAESVSVTLTAASATALTCADTSGLYIGQRGWAVDSSDENNLEIIVVNVISSTQFLCQTVANINNGGAADLSAYDGGTFYFDKQLVEVPGGSADLSTLDTISVDRVPAKTATGFVNATTANVPASTNKNYVTDAQQTAVAALTGGTTTLDSVVDSATRKAVSANEKSWLETASVQPVLATGNGATVDDVIAVLQSLGVCKQE